MNRRDLLTQLGAGSASAATLLALGPHLASAASRTPGQPGSRAQKVSTIVANGLSAASLLAGVGFLVAALFKFHQHKQNPTLGPLERVTSKGVYLITDGTSLEAHGQVEAQEVTTFTRGFGTFGPLEAAIAVIEVNLQQEFPERLVIPATFTLVCNIDAAGISTGQPGGLTVAIPGSPFGTFEPVDPPVGLTQLIAADI